MGRACVLVMVAGCTAESFVAAPQATPHACATATAGAVTPGAIDVAATPTGAVAVWVPPRGPVMMQVLDADARPLGDATLAWDGTFDRARIATVGGELVVGAIDGELGITWMIAAPLGYARMSERAILGGVVGASPIVVANGERVSPNVSYGGLYVTGFDDTFTPRTAQLAVLSGAATDVAAVEVGRTAVAAWSTTDACFIEEIANASTGSGWSDPTPCRAPRLAAIGGEVALVFERDDGVYLVHGAPATLHAATATRLGDGSAPRIVADATRFWISYLAPDGIAVVAIDRDGGVQSTALAADATSGHELALVGDYPRVFASGATGLVATTLCID